MKLTKRLSVATLAEDAQQAAERYGLGLELDDFCTAVCMEQPEMVARAEEQARRFSPLILHAPFNELFPAAIDPQAEALAMRRYQQAYELCAHLGVRRMVVHSGYLPLVYFKSWFLQRSVDFWQRFLLDKPADFCLLLENVLEDEPQLLTQLVCAVDDPRLRLCLDVGHLNTPVSAVPAEEWVQVCAPLLGHVHLHNNDGSWDTHSGLTQGTLQMETLLPLLEQCAPQATLTLETTQALPSCRWLAEHDWI